MIMGVKEIKGRSKELFSISLPMVIEQLFITVMGMISTMLVSSVGQYAKSAVGIVDSISALIIALFAALTTGGTIVVAQYIGKQEILKAKAAAGQAILLSSVFSVGVFLVCTIFRQQIIMGLFGNADQNVIEAAFTFMLIINFSYPILALLQTIFGILRGAGDTLTPMIVSLLMNVVNIILGFILIKGIDIGFIHTPSFGVAGAAVALLVARLVGLIYSGYFIVFKAKGVRLNKMKYFKPDTNIQKTILGFGIPTSFESGLFQVGKIITLKVIVSISAAAIAANTVGNSIFNFVNVPGTAFSTGVMILVGQRIGRGQADDVKKTTNFAIIMGMFFLALVCFVIFLFENPILNLYMPSPEERTYLKDIMHNAYIATPLLWPISFITPAALRATGDMMYTMVVAIISMLVFRVVLSYVFAIYLGMGLTGVWFAMYVDWIIRGTFFFPRLLSGKWQNKGIKD